jgi:hypothetical protein
VSPTLRCEGEGGKSLMFDDTLLFDIHEFSGYERVDKK